MREYLALSLLVAALALSACAATAPSAGPAVDGPAIEVGGCPQPAEGQQVMGSPEVGFCTLMLEGFSLESYSDGSYSVEGPVPTTGIAPRVLIETSTAPGDLTEYVEAYIAERILPDTELRKAPHPVGGEEGLMVEGLPGQDFTRQVFVIHGETLYHFTFLPWDTDAENFEQLFASLVRCSGSSYRPREGRVRPASVSSERGPT